MSARILKSTSPIVILSETKESLFDCNKQKGILPFAQNDKIMTKPVVRDTQLKYYFAGAGGTSLAVLAGTTTGSLPADSTTCWAR